MATILSLAVGLDPDQVIFIPVLIILEEDCLVSLFCTRQSWFGGYTRLGDWFVVRKACSEIYPMALGRGLFGGGKGSRGSWSRIFLLAFWLVPDPEFRSLVFVF